MRALEPALSSRKGEVVLSTLPSAATPITMKGARSESRHSPDATFKDLASQLSAQGTCPLAGLDLLMFPGFTFQM